MQKEGIFNKLNFNKSKEIYLLDIEGLFKAFARTKGPKIKAELIFEQILKAFNADEIFIKEELDKRA